MLEQIGELAYSLTTTDLEFNRQHGLWVNNSDTRQNSVFQVLALTKQELVISAALFEPFNINEKYIYIDLKNSFKPYLLPNNFKDRIELIPVPY